ncbi:MAG: Xaa-Pro peptidase family protein [Candidatus Omnitrophica bacterium]|nr:Xaa-Pro peptidase family protein [Candidatus Omnitrophota bacterium]
MTSRISRLNAVLRKKNIDAFLITSPENIYYLSGFRSTDAFLLITPNDNFIITDFRYKEEARTIDNFKLELIDDDYTVTIKKILKYIDIKNIGFEADSLSFSKASLLKKILKNKKIKMEPLIGVIEELRLLKDKCEINEIKGTIAIAKKVLKTLKIKAGLTEKRLAFELDNLIRVFGGDKSSFPTIVASGKNSSKPHAAVTNKIIKKNELVLIDFGVTCNMYNCDLTRVFLPDKIERLLYDIYQICKEAQQLAITTVKPSVRAKDVDKAARDYITARGYGKQFGHSLGHGVGISIHELPKISLKSEQILKPDMVFTIEPGIYIENMGGVRIEDMVRVTQTGCEVLTDDIPK